MMDNQCNAAIAGVVRAREKAIPGNVGYHLVN